MFSIGLALKGLVAFFVLGKPLSIVAIATNIICELGNRGANLFSASCIPADAPPALPHTKSVLFNVTVSENVPKM